MKYLPIIIVALLLVSAKPRTCDCAKKWKRMEDVIQHFDQRLKRLER